MEILTARPKDMEFGKYKEHLINQKIYIKQYLKGSLCYLASEIYTHRVNFSNPEHDLKMIRKYPPFRGVVKRDLKPL